MHYLTEKDITALNSYIINKYTVFMSIIIFLELNGYKFTVSKKEVINYTVKLMIDDIAIWLRGM